MFTGKYQYSLGNVIILRGNANINGENATIPPPGTPKPRRKTTQSIGTMYILRTWGRPAPQDSSQPPLHGACAVLHCAQSQLPTAHTKGPGGKTNLRTCQVSVQHGVVSVQHGGKPQGNEWKWLELNLTLILTKFN